jgi:hypothetical protein
MNSTILVAMRCLLGFALILVTPLSAEEGFSFGTAWPLENGLVVTNHHVVGYADFIMLSTMDGNQTRATVEVRDVDNDLVLLRPEDPEQLPPAIPIAEDPARLGQAVFTIGYPQVMTLGIAPKLTEGIITAVRGFQDDPRTYQISVGLQHGNSGGPLFNMKGEAIGITSSKMNLLWTQLTGDLPNNIGYAIKTDYLKPLMQSVIKQIKQIPMLPTNPRGLEDLADDLQHSVMIVVAGSNEAFYAKVNQPHSVEQSHSPEHYQVPVSNNAATIFAAVAGLPQLYSFTAIEVDSLYVTQAQNRMETISEVFQAPVDKILYFRWGRSFAPPNTQTAGTTWYTIFTEQQSQIQPYTIWLNGIGDIVADSLFAAFPHGVRHHHRIE